MSAWNRNKVDPSQINNGKEFTEDDILTVDELNAMVNNSFYGADVIDNAMALPIVETTDANADPTVELVDYTKDGKTYKKFKFKNIKGKTGASGGRGEQGVGISSVVQTTTSSVDGGSNIVTVTKTDGGTSTFEVKNGSKGSTGDRGATGISVIGIGISEASTQPTDGRKYTMVVQTDDGITHNAGSFVAPKGDPGALPTIDSSLSSTSTNPVQNKVVNSAISELQSNKLDKTGGTISGTLGISGWNINQDSAGNLVFTKS